MPAFLGITSFGGRDVNRDRIIVGAGTVVYDTVNLPPDSSSSTSAGGNGVSLRIPWYDDETSGTFSPSTGEYWFHGRIFTALNNTNNDTLRLGVARNGSEHVTVSAEDSTNKLVIRVAGSIRATAASAALSVGTWARVHCHVSGVTAGSVVSVYMDGDLSTPVVTYTLIGADATALSAAGLPNEFMVVGKSGDGTGRFDDLFALDPIDAQAPGIQFLVSADIAEQVVNGAGSFTDWLGSYADIDERPASSADKIVASAVGETSSFVKAPIGQDNVFAVKVMVNMSRTGTAAGANVIIGTKEGADTEGRTVPAPGSGDVQAIFQVAPDGTAWSPTKYDATEIAFTSET
ncbi:MAG: hypothetical protein ABL912_01905 [Novosphingobium sp.]